MQSSPVFLPEESHGQRSLVGYHPWGHKELDTNEHTCTWDFCVLSGSFLMLKSQIFFSFMPWDLGASQMVSGK